MATRNNWGTMDKVIVIEGLTRRVFSGEKSMMVLNEIEPGTIVPLHSHPHEQLVYILDGETEFTLGDEALYVKSGDVVLVPGEIPHGLKALGAKTVINLDVFSPVREDYLSIP